MLTHSDVEIVADTIGLFLIVLFSFGVADDLTIFLEDVRAWLQR